MNARHLSVCCMVIFCWRMCVSKLLSRLYIFCEFAWLPWVQHLSNSPHINMVVFVAHMIVCVCVYVYSMECIKIDSNHVLFLLQQSRSHMKYIYKIHSELAFDRSVYVSTPPEQFCIYSSRNGKVPFNFKTMRKIWIVSISYSWWEWNDCPQNYVEKNAVVEANKTENNIFYMFLFLLFGMLCRINY